MLATIGGAVGLGNVWRFPFILGENGGGAFFLLYLICVFAIGVPIMLAETIMGRRGRGSAVGSMAELVRAEGASGFWRIIGWLSVAVPLLGLAYYSIVAGWSLDYLIGALRGQFSGFDGESSGARFAALTGSAPRVLATHAAFIIVTALIVGRGVQQGIEKASTWMMLSLFAILLALLGYSAVAGDFGAALQFLFTPDFSQISRSTLVMALGQAFFSLAVAVGMLITYGAYIPEQVSLGKSVMIIAAVDTAVATIAGLVIFPLVFANGLSPAEGPGLIFVTLPIAFGSMPAGWVVGVLFFALIVFAALTTGLGMLEPPVSWLVEKTRGRRLTLAAAGAGLAWLIGLAPALSFNVLADVRPLGWLPAMQDRNIFESLDYVVANFMLPVNGLLITLFAGWCLRKRTVLAETGWDDALLYRAWRLLVRFVAPVVIAVILVNSLR